jgi:LysR family nod box-dependent transcriptional activator
MRFKGLDLNLLVAFRELIETRSVSRAAERLHLSQPAMSAALTRLRDYFRDDLLVANGRQMYPTAHAASLLPHVRECLHAVEMLVATSARFDPATSQRTFRIITSDYLAAALLVPLVAQLGVQAPGIRLEITLPDDSSRQQLEQGDIDLLLTPEDYISRDHPAELLLEEEHVLVGWRGNPRFDKPIDADEFFAAPHVCVALGHHRTPAFGDRHVQAFGRERRIEVVVPSFSLVPWMLRSTTRIALMQERLAAAMALHFPLVQAPLPFPLPPMREMVQYNRARTADDGLTWLRGMLIDSAGRKTGGAGAPPTVAARG